jgi:hypothetical protein
MPTTAKLTFDEGTTTNVATNTITEDAVTKHLNRTILNTSAGVEVAPLTDTQLRATAVPVSGTFYQATQPISAAACRCRVEPLPAPIRVLAIPAWLLSIPRFPLKARR